jgi:hypothetical protein
MSIIQGQTTSFKASLYNVLVTGTFKMALYTANADLNQSTTAYTTSNEVVASGYTAGGKALTGVTLSTDPTTSTVYVNFDNVSWTAALTARCALIYNSSTLASVAVIDFGADKSSSTTFLVTMPANTSTTALIRSA